MWNPDQAPKLSFENLARRFGLAKARRLWAIHELRIKRAEAAAAAQEQAWAAERQRRGPLVVKNDFDFYPTFHISPYTYKALHRSTLPEKGCTGGEALKDKSYMRDFLKRHPECAPPKIVSKEITSGWTAALDAAAQQGKMERALKHALVNRQLETAAAEGRQNQPHSLLRTA